jgi:hypothetical protein
MLSVSSTLVINLLGSVRVKGYTVYNILRTASVFGPHWTACVYLYLLLVSKGEGKGKGNADI